jgi:hypothetical protein
MLYCVDEMPIRIRSISKRRTRRTVSLRTLGASVLLFFLGGQVAFAGIVNSNFQTTIPPDGGSGGEVAGYVDILNPERTPITIRVSGTFSDIDICDDDELAEWRLPYGSNNRRLTITLGPEETVRVLFPLVFVCPAAAANAAAYLTEGKLDFGFTVTITGIRDTTSTDETDTTWDEESPTRFRVQAADEGTFAGFLAAVEETDLRIVRLEGAAQRTLPDTDGDGPGCPSRFSGTWESAMEFQPDPLTLLDFSHELALTYMVGGVGDWRFTSRSTFDETGLTVQQFDTTGYLGSHTPRVRVTVPATAPQSTSLILDWQVGLGGVSILYQAIYEADQCGYAFGLQGQTPRDYGYLSNRVLTPLSFWFRTYFNATKVNPGMPLDYVRYGPYSYKNYILGDCEDGISFTGFEAYVRGSLLNVELWIDPTDLSGTVDFIIEEIGFSWLDLYATYAFALDESSLSLYPRFHFALEEEVCFQPYIQILFSEGTEGFHIDEFHLYGLSIRTESDGLALALNSFWMPTTSVDLFSVSRADDPPCWDEDFAFNVIAIFSDDAPGPFGLSDLQISLSTVIAPRFVPFRLASLIAIDFDRPPGLQWTQWTLDFEIPLAI